jgi:hypothetical protein
MDNKQNLELIIDSVLNLSMVIKELFTYQNYDFNKIYLCKERDLIKPIYDGVEELKKDNIFTKEDWIYAINYLEKNYNLQLNNPDIVLDEIITILTSLFGLSLTSIRPKEINNETE